jgi:chaperone modulatory protein CbpM
MMRLTSVVALFSDLGEPELLAWVERGWIHPDAAGAEPVFDEIDVARVRLIHDLRSVMLIEDETIPMILSLLDQVYDLRAGLRAVLRAVDAQPAPVREAILAAIG